jgi:hypothetical protein
MIRVRGQTIPRFTLQLYGTVETQLIQDALYPDPEAEAMFKFTEGRGCGSPGCESRTTARVKRHVVGMGTHQFFLCAKHVRRTDKAHPVKAWQPSRTKRYP